MVRGGPSRSSHVTSDGVQYCFLHLQFQMLETYPARPLSGPLCLELGLFDADGIIQYRLAHKMPQRHAVDSVGVESYVLRRGVAFLASTMYIRLAWPGSKSRAYVGGGSGSPRFYRSVQPGPRHRSPALRTPAAAKTSGSAVFPRPRQGSTRGGDTEMQQAPLFVVMFSKRHGRL